MAPPNDYWARRALARQAAYDRASDTAMRAIAAAYDRAMAQLEADIETILGNYAAFHGLSREEARDFLAAPCDRALLDELRERLGRISDPAARRRLLARLNAPAYAARITRLEAVQEAARVQLSQVSDAELAAMTRHLTGVAVEANSRTMFDIQQRAGAAFDFAGMSARRVEQVLRYQWSGEHYSARVWKNGDALAGMLSRALKEQLMAGRASKQTMAELQSLANAGKLAANRLLRTETNYVAGQAEAEAYAQAGIEQYRYLAVLDARTSRVCRELDGKTFKVSEQQVGVNMHPMHPWCRSSTEPVIEVADSSRMRRWARDPKTGEPMRVPRDMTYAQWERMMDERYGHDTVAVARKKLYNEAADKRQLKRYQRVIGKNEFTRSLDAFQTMKYKNAQTYRFVKLDYKRQGRLLADPSLALPNAAKATAADGKFAEYLFNPENPDGWAKGVAFTSRLGYNGDNWTGMKKEILSSAGKFPSASGKLGEYGIKYSQDIILYGKKSKPMNVMIGWMVNGDKTWLTTIIPKEVE